MKEKFLALDRIKQILQEEKNLGKKIVHCHGVFDLFHLGHLIHLKQAKAQGDILVVSLTPDIYVNKGPSRPYFTEDLRMQFIASLEIVDYIVLNDTKDALSIIEKIRPDFYVKGKEYEDHKKDVTGRIKVEVDAVEQYKGKVIYTEGKIFSSSSIINQFFTSYTPLQKKLIQKIKSTYKIEEIFEKIDSLSSLTVLVLADSYLQIDHFLQPRCSMKQAYFSTGETESFQGAFFVDQIIKEFATCQFPQSLVETLPKKNRFFLEKEKQLLYETDHSLFTEKKVQLLLKKIKNNLQGMDLVFAYDFQMGFFQQSILGLLKEASTSLALGNFTKDYLRSCKAGLLREDIDAIWGGYIDNTSNPLINIYSDDAKTAIVQVNKNLEVLLTSGQVEITISAFENSLCAETFFPIASLCLRKGLSVELSGFLGAIYSSMGSSKVATKEAFKKYLIHLLK